MVPGRDLRRGGSSECAVFYGRAQIAGVEPGRQVRLRGTVGIGGDGHPAMINPACEPLR